MHTIYLLDLNYTLVSNSRTKISPFIRQIEQETYRDWLVNLLRGKPVILVTARPARYERPTMDRIRRLTGLDFLAAYFNDLNLPPPQLKGRIFAERIRPSWLDGPFVALESNPATRAVYARLGVPAYAVPDTPWSALPEGALCPQMP
jgi:hypothetical protein